MAKRIVGRYEIERGIGQGGMAAVYLARQLDLDRLVALKELRALKTFDPSIAQRFLREARLAGSLSHPNIVTVYEYFEADRIPYIAMEYLPRGSLRPYMHGLTLAQVGGVLEGVLAGLDQAARHGIVHRDIKPENLLLTGDGRIKIADFGIAKPATALETQAQMTAAGLTVGTPNYMAPEQAMARELGPWTDLYSVGITTFEMLVGRTPFGDTPEPMAVVMRQVNEPVPRVHDVAPHVDEWISDWVAWLVSKAPAERPQSAGQAWDAFEEALIAVLGPRWRRDARLLQRDNRTPATAPIVRKRPTLRAPRVAATVPPRRALAKTAPATPPQPARRRRRRGTSLAAASLVAAVVALGAAGVGALGGRGGGAGPQTVAVVPPTRQLPSTQVAVTTTASIPPVTTPAAAATTALAKQVAPAKTLARQYKQAAANQPAGTDPQLIAALNAIAQSYTAAAAAADRNDAAGYNAAVSTAASRTSALTPAPSQATSTPAAQTAPPPASSNASPCAGDSSSDDPSDDSCSAP